MAERVAIIPARGGSKGVPGKNKRLVGGKPLISYTICAAQAAQTIDRVIVTTDDMETAAIARNLGAKVVTRPAAIAGDESPVIDAVLHALGEENICEPAAVALLQPTSPLRTADDIDAAMALFLERGITVCSVYRTEDAHPARMYRIEDGRLVSLMRELASVRRQDLPPLFHRNGAIYVFGSSSLGRREIIGETMIPYEMAGDCSINIDTELDLLLLEAYLAKPR